MNKTQNQIYKTDRLKNSPISLVSKKWFGQRERPLVRVQRTVRRQGLFPLPGGTSRSWQTNVFLKSAVVVRRRGARTFSISRTLSYGPIRSRHPDVAARRRGRSGVRIKHPIGRPQDTLIRRNFHHAITHWISVRLEYSFRVLSVLHPGLPGFVHAFQGSWRGTGTAANLGICLSLTLVSWIALRDFHKNRRLAGRVDVALGAVRPEVAGAAVAAQLGVGVAKLAGGI